MFILVITPGPDLVFITANSIASGKKGGIASALGCTSGVFAHAVLAAFGLTAIVATYQPAYQAVRIAGALYLAYLGLIMIMSKKPSISINESEKRKSSFALYRQGVINNLMNPKAILFSLTFLPQFTDPARGSIWAQIILLGMVLALVMISIEIPIAVTSGQLGIWFTKKAKAALLCPAGAPFRNNSHYFKVLNCSFRSTY